MSGEEARDAGMIVCFIIDISENPSSQRRRRLLYRRTIHPRLNKSKSKSDLVSVTNNSSHILITQRT
jgi:hypothetical protein